jgi:hypothetical protein
MAIDIVVVLLVLVPVWGVSLPSFYIQGGGVTRKVPESITIVVLIGFYL